MALMAHRGPMKKDLTPIGIHRPGQIVKHQGKGSAPFPPQPKPGPLTQGAPSMNNYAKASPLPVPPPSPSPMGGAPMGAPPAMMGDSMTGRNNGMV